MATHSTPMSEKSSMADLADNHPKESNLTFGVSDFPDQFPEKVDDQDAPVENASDFPDGGTRAWCVAAGTAGITFCTLGYLNSYGVFQGYYELHQLAHLSPSKIAWIGSIQSFFVFSGGLVGGPLFDLYGAKVIRPFAVLFVLSIMMTSLCTEFWQFVLAQGLLGGLSAGMVMQPSLGAVGQYFDKKRTAAVGCGIAGSSIGGVVLPIAMSKMLEHSNLGFAWTVRIIGFVILALLTPACIAVKARLPPRKKNFFLFAAFKSPSYNLLIVAGIFGFLGLFTPLFYLPTYAISRGMSPGLAFYLASIFNGASFPGRIFPAILADKLGRYNVFILTVVSCGILSFVWQRVETNAALIVFAAIFGFCSGTIITGMAIAFMSITEDPVEIPTVMGQAMAISSIAALVGPPINGALVTHYQSFDQLADFSGSCCLVAALFIAVAKFYTGKGMLSLT